MPLFLLVCGMIIFGLGIIAIILIFVYGLFFDKGSDDFF